MIYLLHFCHRGHRPGGDEVRESLRSLPQWSYDDHRLSYFDEDTDLGFDLSLAEEGEEDGSIWATAGLRLGCTRMAGEDYGKVIAQLAERFSSDVLDPQLRDTPLAFDVSHFVPAWQDANRAAWSRRLNSSSPPPRTCKASALAAIWRWNRERAERSLQLGEDVFVPLILLFRRAEEYLTTVVWTDAIPILMPKVDVVMAFNMDINKTKKWFWQQVPPKYTLHRWPEVEKLVSSFEEASCGVPARRVFPLTPPDTRKIEAMFRSGPDFGKFRSVPWLEVCEEDLLAEAGAQPVEERPLRYRLRAPLPLAPPPLKDKFFDLRFGIADAILREDVASFHLRARAGGETIGLWVDLFAAWTEDLSQGVLMRRGTAAYRSAGAESDRLLALLAEAYGCELPPGQQMAASIPCQAVMLKGDPADLERVHLKIKLFFGSGGEDHAQLYSNLDLLGGLAEIREKDPGFRGPLLAALTGSGLVELASQ